MILFSFYFIGCSDSSQKQLELEAKIDSLESIIASQDYKENPKNELNVDTLDLEDGDQVFVFNFDEGTGDFLSSADTPQTKALNGLKEFPENDDRRKYCDVNVTNKKYGRTENFQDYCELTIKNSDSREVVAIEVGHKNDYSRDFLRHKIRIKPGQKKTVRIMIDSDRDTSQDMVGLVSVVFANGESYEFPGRIYYYKSE
jgi:hypothetical protein